MLHVCFVLLRFRHAFTEAAALRSVVVRYTCVPAATRALHFFFYSFLGDVAFSEYFLYYCRCRFVWRVTSHVSPLGMSFFYLVTTGLIFDISLCENSFFLITFESFLFIPSPMHRSDERLTKSVCEYFYSP